MSDKESKAPENNWLGRLADGLGLKPNQVGMLKLVAIGLVLGILFLNAGELFGVSGGGDRPPNGSIAVNAQAASTPDELARLEQQLAQELEQRLALIAGAGRVSASVQLAAGPTVVPVINSNITETTTTEKIAESGERVQKQNGQEKTHVMVREGGNESLAVSQQLREQIAGVLITAEGASNSKVRYMLHQAAVTYLNIPAHQVEVLPAGGR